VRTPLSVVEDSAQCGERHWLLVSQRTGRQQRFSPWQLVDVMVGIETGYSAAGGSATGAAKRATTWAVVVELSVEWSSAADRSCVVVSATQDHVADALGAKGGHVVV